jgi:signal peptidase I
VRTQYEELLTSETMSEESQQRLELGCELVTDVARSFETVCLKVTGSSMIPAIWPGDVLTARNCDIHEIQPGQIVLYRRQKGLVAHRATHVTGYLLITRGDTLQNDDPPIQASDIVGQVVSLVRNGRPVNLRHTPWQRFSSSVLRRSDFCLRMTLRLGRRLQGARI